MRYFGIVIPKTVRRNDGLLIRIFLTALIVYPVMIFMTYHGINARADPLNDAERPEEAFNQFEKELEPEQRMKIGEKIEGTKLKHRIEMKRIGLLDWGEGTNIISMLSRDTVEVEELGGYYIRCEEGYMAGNCSYDRNIPLFTFLSQGTMNAGMEQGTLHRLWRNDTVATEFSYYLERSAYYDSRMRKKGFNYSPVESAYYTDSGLYMIGSHQGNITIDSQSYRPERKGHLMYINSSLSPGTHSITAGEQSFDFKVVYPEPEYGTNEFGSFIIGATDKYDRAILTGSKGVKKIQLDSENRTSVEPPEKTFLKNETGSRLHFREFQVKYISEEVNRTVIYGENPEEEEAEVEDLYFYGMNEQEYLETQSELDTYGVLPFFRTPEEKARSF